jgi:aryl-alcohol dehydrogenase-like predicted oxidoreductase
MTRAARRGAGMSQKIDVSPVGAGSAKPVSTMALGTAWFRCDKQDMWFDLLDRYAACGGTTIDSGHIYGDSERIIGSWMAARANRGRLFLFTKGGHGEGGLLPATDLKKIIDRELTQSLERLQTDYVDLYGLHRDNPSAPVGPIVECLNEHIASGRVRTICASNWEYARVDEANTYAETHGLTGFTAVSNNLSLAVPAEPFYPGLVSTDQAGRRWHERTGIPLFSWSSQARGFFSGRYRPETIEQAAKNTDEFTKRMVQVYCTRENLERLRRAESLSRDKGGCSAMQVALAWVVHQPFKVVPIVGPRSSEELESCVVALSLELTMADVKWLNLEV